MEIIFVINGTLQRGIDNELNPPKVAKEFGPDTFNIDYNWSIETKPNVILKSAREVEMTTVKELESIRGTLNLEMGVLTFPEDNLTQRYQGTSFVAMWIRDSDHVIQRVLDLIPRLGFDIFVEVKYLDRVLTFTGFRFADGSAEQEEHNWCPLSTYRVVELLSDQVDLDTEFKATITLQFHNTD